MESDDFTVDDIMDCVAQATSRRIGIPMGVNDLLALYGVASESTNEQSTLWLALSHCVWE